MSLRVVVARTDMVLFLEVPSSYELSHRLFCRPCLDLGRWTRVRQLCGVLRPALGIEQVRPVRIPQVLSPRP